MELDRELDDLYSLPLEQFTAARNALSARLRKDGDRESADRVKALKKPTAVAWAANQLARTEPRLVERLLEATDQLARAKGETARDVLAGQRDALRDLTRAAKGLASGAGALERLSSTLRAAAVDEEARALLRRGRLEREVESTGFSAVAGAAPAKARPKRLKPKPGDELAERRHRREEEQRRLRELRDRARELARAADQAERDADRLEAELERAREVADEARDQADQAAEELDAAEQEARPKRGSSSGRTRRR